MSVAQSWLTLCNPMNHSMPAFLSITNSQSLPKLMSIDWVGDAIQLTHHLSSPSPPALNLSQYQGLFKWSALHMRWSKYWGFSFNISPSNEHPGLISFRMEWLDLLEDQGTLKGLLQHHSPKHQFFSAQLSL